MKKFVYCSFIVTVLLACGGEGYHYLPPGYEDPSKKEDESSTVEEADVEEDVGEGGSPAKSKEDAGSAGEESLAGSSSIEIELDSAGSAGVPVVK